MRVNHSPAGRGLSVILKATDMCNMACTFCSVGPAGTHRMSWPDFERLAVELERSIQRWHLRTVGVTFHGGEPTVLGAEWIDRACRRLQQLPVDVPLSMQSNLIHFTDEMVDVVRRHDIRVGSSFDPLVRARRLANGADAYPKWTRVYERLCGEGLSIGAIFVVTRDALGRVDELYDACEALDAHSEQPFGLQVNPVYPQGRAHGKGEMLLEARDFGEFLVQLYERWERSGRSINVTPLRQLARNFEWPSDPSPLLCSFSGNCSMSHVGVDYDLRVAGCGRRLDSQAFLGSLRDAHLDDLMTGSEEKGLIAGRSAQLQAGDCTQCRFFGLCAGGCPDSAELGTGSLMERHPWCEAYTMLFEKLERSVRPRKGRAEMRTTIRVGSRPSEVRGGPVAGSRVQRWLMPTPDGAALRFDSPMAGLLKEETGLLRIRVHNRHVRALVMWQDLLRRPKVLVELYEAEGLDGALNLLNGLEATVALEVPRIAAQPGGEEALAAALERYIRDPLWRIQIRPFADLMHAAIEGERVESSTRWGLPPGTFDVVWPPNDAVGDDAAAVAQLRRDVAMGEAGWKEEHASCRECPRLAMCGGRLAEDGVPCSPGARRLVDRIHLEAETIRGQLGLERDPEVPAEAPS